MSLPPSKFFSSIIPFLSPLLVSGTNFSDIRSMATKFPGDLTNLTGFECHLGGDHPHADWGIELLGEDRTKDTLADFLENKICLEMLPQSESWENLGKFSRTWIDPDSELFRKVRALWFEFDVVDHLQMLPFPSVFFIPYHIPGGSARSSYDWIFRDVLRMFDDSGCLSQIEKTSERCFEKLPEDASLFILGCMVSRKVHFTRLSFKFDDPSKIPVYLSDIGWPYQDAPLSHLLTDFRNNGVTRFILDLDLWSKIGPKIGIECSFSPTKFHKEPKWKSLTEYLVAGKLMTQAEADALLSFPGSSKIKLGSAAVAANEYSRNKSAQTSRIVRYISHIKVVYNPHGPLKAKAYLGIRHVQDKGLNAGISPISRVQEKNGGQIQY